MLDDFCDFIIGKFSFRILEFSIIMEKVNSFTFLLIIR